jgi:hypothetical protein
MPERRGRRLAGAPKSGNEIFVSGLSNFWWMLHNHLMIIDSPVSHWHFSLLFFKENCFYPLHKSPFSELLLLLF